MILQNFGVRFFLQRSHLPQRCHQFFHLFVELVIAFLGGLHFLRQLLFAGLDRLANEFDFLLRLFNLRRCFHVAKWIQCWQQPDKECQDAEHTSLHSDRSFNFVGNHVRRHDARRNSCGGLFDQRLILTCRRRQCRQRQKQIISLCMPIDGARGCRFFHSTVKQPGRAGSHGGKRQQPYQRLSTLREQSQ